MLAACLLVITNATSTVADSFAICVRGIADVNGDGVDDVVVSDPSYRGFGAIWTVSGRDGSRIGCALGSEKRSGLGRSYFVSNSEVCACVDSPDGPVLIYYDGKTLEPRRKSEVVARAQGFDALVDSAGDIDGDGVTDAVLCLSPNDLKHSFLELVSGRSGKRVRTIELGWSGGERANTVASLGDLDGDGVSDFGVSAGLRFPDGARNRVMLHSGRTGAGIGELVNTGKSTRVVAFGSIADVDGDGVRDVAVLDEDEGSLCAFSGRTHQRLRKPALCWAGATGTQFGCVATLADIDGDGRRDFGVAIDSFPAGFAAVFSGASGDWIRTHDWSQFPKTDGCPVCIADIGDLDHDGRGDYVVGTSHHWDGNETSSVTAFSGATGKKLWVIDERSLTRAP